METANSKPRNLDALTGLRFVAAFMVLLVHAIKFQRGHSTLGPIASNAVAFFFVLSGFILTYVYHDRLGKIGTFRFYIARFARIWPLHVVCLLAGLVVMWSQRPESLIRYSSQIPIHLALIQSWLPFEGVALRFNGPAWSISTEFAFYLVFPLMLGLLKRRKVLLVCICTMLVVSGIGAMEFAIHAGWVTLKHATGMVYVHPLIRIFDFMMGMLTASLFIERHQQTVNEVDPPVRLVIRDTVFELLSIALMVGAVYLAGFGEIKNFLGSKPFLSMTRVWLSRGGAGLICFCVVIWVFSTSRGFLAEFMSTKTMVYLGEISFALYLIQVPVLTVLVRETKQLQMPTLYFVVLVTAVCVAFSMFLYAMIEAPCRRYLIGSSGYHWRAIVSILRGSLRNLATGNVGLVAGLILLVSCGLVRYEQYRSLSYTEPAELISVANRMAGVQFDRVTFEGEATLHWLDVDDRGDELEITMWWRLLEGHKRPRFIHFCDEQGKVLSTNWNLPDFVGKPAGSFILERCVVEKTGIKPGTRFIGVGFWARELGGAPADRGRRQMNQRRLLVAELAPKGVIGINNAKATINVPSVSDSLSVVAEAPTTKF